MPPFLYQINSTKDGLGYHDDGDYDITGMAAKDEEYNNNNNNQGGSNKKKKKNSNNALTKEVLRKARKNKASVKAAAGGEEGSSPNKVRCHDSFFNFGRGFCWATIVLGGLSEEPLSDMGNVDYVSNSFMTHTHKSKLPLSPPHSLFFVYFQFLQLHQKFWVKNINIGE